MEHRSVHRTLERGRWRGISQASVYIKTGEACLATEWATASGALAQSAVDLRALQRAGFAPAVRARRRALPW